MNPELRRLGTVLAEDYSYAVELHDESIIAVRDGECVLVGRQDDEWFARTAAPHRWIADGAGSAAEAVAAVEEWLDARGQP